MKKLLGILGTIIISGSGMTGVVANSSYSVQDTRKIEKNPVASIYRFEKSRYSRNVGDVYFGTINGVYLAKMGSWTADTRIDGINNAVAEIKDVNDNGAVFVRTTNGEAYKKYWTNN